MLLRITILLMTLLISACASDQLIQTEDEFISSKNEPAVKVHLRKAEAHFSELKNLNAHSLFPKDFNKIKNQFSELMKLLEKNETQAAIQQEPYLINQMIQLEIETLKTSNLQESINYIDKAKQLDAADHAPKSLKQAENLLHLTQAFIEKSYRDRHAISQQSRETLKSAKKLYFVSKEAQEAYKNSDEALEQKIISHYKFLSELGAALKLKPLEIQDYTSQRNELLEQITNMQSLANETQACLPKTTNSEEHVIQKQPEQPKAILSHETNKAVLPELFNPSNYSDNDKLDEENLEFDAIEIVK